MIKNNSLPAPPFSSVFFLLEYQVHRLVDVLDGVGWFGKALLHRQEVSRRVLQCHGVLGVGAKDPCLYQDGVAVFGTSFHRLDALLVVVRTNQMLDASAQGQLFATGSASRSPCSYAVLLTAILMEVPGTIIRVVHCIRNVAL